MKNKFVGKSHDKVVMNALAHAKNTEGRNREGVGRCCNSVNPIVQNALEYKRACNASFKVGDVVGLPIMDGGRRDYVVIGTKGSGWYYVGKAEDPYVGQECVRFDAMKGKGRTVSVPKDAVINGKCDSTDTACNGSGIKVGDIVQVGYEPDNARRGIVGKTGEVLSQSSGFALLDIGGKEMFVQRSSLKIVNSACCENAVNLGMVTLKSPEAEEVQKLARTKGYAAAKKYCAEKKAEIEKVDGHRAWYFLDAALDAGKMAGMNSCCENAVPVDGSFTPMAYIKGMIKVIEANPSAKELEGGAWKVVRDKPNYKALASTAEYKKLDKMVGINADVVENIQMRYTVKYRDGYEHPVESYGGSDLKRKANGIYKQLHGDVVKVIDESGKDVTKEVANTECCNAKFKVGDKVRYYHGGNTPFKVVKIEGSTYFVAPDDNMFGVEDGVPAPERKLKPLNAVCNFDVKTRGAQEVIKEIAAIPGGPSNLKRAQALAIQKKVGASDKDFDAALRFFQWDGIADVQNEESVCNAKFKKGDRVVTVSGVHGEVLTVLDDGNYAVQFDGRELSKVPEYRLKAEV